MRSKRFRAEDRGFLSEAGQFPFGKPSWQQLAATFCRACQLRGGMRGCSRSMFHVSGSLSSVSSACTSCDHLRRGVTPASRASHAFSFYVFVISGSRRGLRGVLRGEPTMIRMYGPGKSIFSQHSRTSAGPRAGSS